MATGGDAFGLDDPELDFNIDNEPYDDYDEQEVDTTRPFQPGAASTPYHGGEEIQMQTMQHEQSGLPDTSYEETPLLGAQAESQRSWDALTRFFPDASSIDLEATYSKTGRLQVKMAGFGKKAYELFTKDRSGRQQLNPKLTKEIKQSLGRRAEQIIEEDSNTALKQRQRLEEAEKQLREAEKIAAEREKESQEMQDLERKIERTQANIDAIQEEQGSNLESEAELRRLKQLKKNHQTELENKKKELSELEKQAKNKEKLQEKVDRERKKLYGIERERNAIEERLNETKRFDELNDDESRLKRLNEEDQAIIDDANASEFEKEAAEERMVARKEELSRLQAQIAEREAAMPLRERVREIFKKYGVTVTAIFLAAGITIGAVVGAITNALKSMGKQLANGLKAVGAKAAAALPGLIGAVVSFLFKTAGQAIGYLAEHTWLLILAAVVFIFEKYIKRRG